MRDGRHPFADQSTTGSRSVTLWTCVGPVAKILVVQDGFYSDLKSAPEPEDGYVAAAPESSSCVPRTFGAIFRLIIQKQQRLGSYC
ncbi:MAG: hypothetical protein BRD25_01070 [Bacteroidetes bacterium QH_1_61_8]|nr:MAG: hypothetical protein BRD25_01070 [Bacteroidetes bacterium QH_1_61_8]